MSHAKHPGYERGYADYKESKPCLVTKTRKGLQFNVEGEWELDAAWGNAYVEGYTQAIKDDPADVPMASKERLRH